MREAALPTVSVVIPTRNRPALLREALDSVRAQTFTDYEIIVVINGPDNPFTAATYRVAEAAGASILRISAGGIAVALNAGVRAARGRWIAFLDDDDLWEPDKLETEIGIGEAEGADVLFCDVYMFDGATRVRLDPIRPPPHLTPREAMTIRNCGRGCSSTTVRREAVLAAGEFDTSLASPDWDMWMRLSWAHRLRWIDRYLASLRIHGANSSETMSWAKTLLSILWKAHRTLPDDLGHIRWRIFLEMIRVANKGAERFLRVKLRRALGGQRPNRSLSPGA